MIEQIFWWTGAVVAICACVMIACLFLCGAAWAVKKAFNYWWDRTLTIYRFESLRYYFGIMVENGRTGLLKEVEKSKQEAQQQERDQ
ncbi:hypothetical protein [Pseudomonas xionganensis]|uniref:Uncharacterized protein n=1 Tax=Pseudomonas xionganensis TaxID=2654845 RepID=A0A6I4KX56_9PSED|nr:hypothetical protein [Pseudomonas xionganensis]MVW75352.1 hypothetical protein [Pseudomonas xionganensis]